VRTVLPYLLQGVALCLGGFAFYYLLRKLSQVNSATSSETLEATLAELKSWKRTVNGELESQFERIRTIAGRMDRQNRKEKTSQEPQQEGSGQPNDLDDQGKLNAILAHRFHGG
jgi:hypothetical protein